MASSFSDGLLYAHRRWKIRHHGGAWLRPWATDAKRRKGAGPQLRRAVAPTLLPSTVAELDGQEIPGNFRPVSGTYCVGSFFPRGSAACGRLD